jgi:hypothetical protein
VSSAVDLQNVSETFGAEIVKNLNSLTNMLKGSLAQNFIPMKSKALLTEKRRHGTFI